MPGDAESLTRLDEALLRLRRVTAAPPPSLVVEAGAGAPAVPASTVFVVDACARAGRGLSVGEVARALDVEHSTASRLVDRAVRGAFVERSPSTADARRVELTLTPAGRALHERAAAFRQARLGQVVSDWPAGDVEVLADLLDRFAAAAAAGQEAFRQQPGGRPPWQQDAAGPAPQGGSQ